MKHTDVKPTQISFVTYVVIFICAALLLAGVSIYQIIRPPQSIDDIMAYEHGGNIGTDKIYSQLENPTAGTPKSEFISDGSIELDILQLREITAGIGAEGNEYGILTIEVTNNSGRKLIIGLSNYREYCFNDDWYAIGAMGYERFIAKNLPGIQSNLYHGKVIEPGDTTIEVKVDNYDARTNKASGPHKFKLADGKHRIVMRLFEYIDKDQIYDEEPVPYGFVYAEFEVKNNKLV